MQPPFENDELANDVYVLLKLELVMLKIPVP